MRLKKIIIKKRIEKQMKIKRMRTKFDIKTEWNQMPRDEIEKKSIKKFKTNSNHKNDDSI